MFSLTFKEKLAYIRNRLVPEANYEYKFNGVERNIGGGTLIEWIDEFYKDSPNNKKFILITCNEVFRLYIFPEIYKDKG